MGQARVSITPSDAWSDVRLTPLQCRLLGLIGSYLGKDNKAWPSQSTLAKDLNVSRKAVNDGVKALSKYGYVEVQARHRPDGGRSSNCYLVVMDPLSRKGNAPSEDKVTPPSPESDTPCNPLEVTPPVTSEGDTHKKDTIERPIEQSAFEQAWELYRSCPMKSRQTKKLAQAQWPKAVKKADPDTILKAIAQEVKDRTNPKDFVPNLPDMHRWLRDERWQDVEQSEPAPSPESLTLDDWKKAASAYCELQVWPRDGYGPAPHEMGCIAPAGLLRTIAGKMSGHRWHDRITENIPHKEQAA